MLARSLCRATRRATHRHASTLGAPVASLPAVGGALTGAFAAELKYTGRPDLSILLFPEGAACAGVFTTSLAPSAPVDWCREALGGAGEGGRCKAVLVNAGNANAFTGRRGVQAVEASAGALAGLLGCAPSEVLLASTGVIGEPLDHAALTAKLPQLVDSATAGGGGWADAAAGIMTTDTFAKMATRAFQFGGQTATLNGICKGSGMIAPNMATMLGFLVTDAALPPVMLQRALDTAVKRSFNSITVDSDTSTSDTVLVAATGAVGSVADAEAPGAEEEFAAALEAIMIELAQQIVKDGEGATKFVTVKVTGAEHESAARTIGLSIANSPLVKTALAGEDANWGRVVAAVGKAGERANRDGLRVSIGGVLVASDGEVRPEYDEEASGTAAYMKTSEIEIEVDVGIADGAATVWTCDLTHEYIVINADYRS